MSGNSTSRQVQDLDPEHFMAGKGDAVAADASS